LIEKHNVQFVGTHRLLIIVGKYTNQNHQVRLNMGRIQNCVAQIVWPKLCGPNCVALLSGRSSSFED